MKTEEEALRSELSKKLKHIKHKILVLSGKGGVGKSTVSCQLAFYLAHLGYEVGLMDLDLCGPSIPRMMGIENQDMFRSNSGWSPVYVEDNLGVVSIGFMLPNKDDAVIWRGPKKNGLIKQFIMDVDWGKLDFLIIDTPPGTSDEHISIVQYLDLGKNQDKDGSILVTTGQQVSVNDVRKEISFCNKTNVRVLGVVENMRHLTCEKCGHANMLFKSNKVGIQQMCNDFKVDLLGGLGFSPILLNLCENGKGVWGIERGEEDVEMDENQKKVLRKIGQDFETVFGKVIKKVNAELPEKEEEFYE
jgi:Mrp family chromosome partitioning ATPase